MGVSCNFATRPSGQFRRRQREPNVHVFLPAIMIGLTASFAEIEP